MKQTKQRPDNLRFRPLTRADVENAHVCLLLITSLTERHDELAYTRFYSNDLSRSLDRYSKDKLTMLFEGTEGLSAFDEVTEQQQVFNRLINIFFALKDQPEAVEKRFNDGLYNLCVQCGISQEILNS